MSFSGRLPDQKSRKIDISEKATGLKKYNFGKGIWDHMVFWAKKVGFVKDLKLILVFSEK
jgi:hypothetical protein